MWHLRGLNSSITMNVALNSSVPLKLIIRLSYKGIHFFNATEDVYFCHAIHVGDAEDIDKALVDGI